MVLLDTNIVIYFFKNQGEVAKRILATPPSNIAVSVITQYELYVGLVKSQYNKRRHQLDRFLQTITVLPFEEKEVMASALLRTGLEKGGEPIGPMDTLIAGTALANNCTLITHNTNEFSRVPGLALDDWY